jgi:hypothetical protein
VRSFFDEHRLQLEMMSVTVEDILAAAEPNRDLSSKGDSPTIYLSDSFFTLFEKMDVKDEAYQIHDASGECIAGIKADALLEGFQTVRRKLKG